MKYRQLNPPGKKYVTFQIDYDDACKQMPDDYERWRIRSKLVEEVDRWCQENIPERDWSRYSTNDTIAIRVDSPYALSFKMRWC